MFRGSPDVSLLMYRAQASCKKSQSSYNVEVKKIRLLLKFKKKYGVLIKNDKLTITVSTF